MVPAGGRDHGRGAYRLVRRVRPVVRYLVLFVSITPETAWIVHFAPSEVIIPVAAAFLVTTPAEFPLFVTVGIAGAVVGSLVA
jgi:membrane protein DedA with SNARE-associated domain